MTTLTLPSPLEDDRQPRRERMGKVSRAAYIDFGHGVRYVAGKLIRCKEPAKAPHVVLTLQAYQRHNTLQPVLQPTDRMLSRWGESEGSGLPIADPSTRETHYTPLPHELQAKVSAIVTGSPWELFTRKWYRTDLTAKDLAVALMVSRTQLYADWRSSLWYFNGRFYAECVHE